MINDGNRSLVDLVQTLIDQVGRLMRDEVALMKAEAGEKARMATRGLSMIAIGIVIALPALFILFLAGVMALGMVVELWLAALIVGGGAALVALALVIAGRSKLSAEKLAPRRTIVSIKRDVGFAESHLKGGA
jgi:hypothetical protein